MAFSVSELAMLGGAAAVAYWAFNRLNKPVVTVTPVTSAPPIRALPPVQTQDAVAGQNVPVTQHPVLEPPKVKEEKLSHTLFIIEKSGDHQKVPVYTEEEARGLCPQGYDYTGIVVPAIYSDPPQTTGVARCTHPEYVPPRPIQPANCPEGETKHQIQGGDFKNPTVIVCGPLDSKDSRWQKAGAKYVPPPCPTGYLLRTSRSEWNVASGPVRWCEKQS